MNDRIDEFQNEDALKFPREQGFFDRSIIVRVIIGLCFAIALFLFLHFREVRVEVLELDNIATGYIVAQLDFDFLDQDATVILREEAARDIGKIYLISEKEIRSRRLEFDNLLLYDQQWRSQLPKATFEDMYQAGDLVEKVLLNIRFTDPRTIRKMKTIDLNTDSFLIFTPTDPKFPILLPLSVWGVIKERAQAIDGTLPSETFEFALSYFKGKEWDLDEDISAFQYIRSKVQAKVKDKYTHISSGTKIINQGDRVTTRHIAMLQAMKKALSDERNLWHPMSIIGSMLLVVLLIGISIAYLRLNHPDILVSNRKLCLIVTILLITLALSKVTEFFLLNSKINLIELIRYPVLVPFAAIMLSSLMNASIATFAAAFLTVVFSMGLAFDRQGFILVNLAAALVTILSTRALHRRKEVFVICGKAWLACIAVLVANYFYQHTTMRFVLFTDIVSSGLCMLFTGVLVVGLLPLLESGFKIMTDVSLMEYMDPNSDLLRRLSLEASGTYQHSVLVGNLAESAALAIGANGLFCRVSTLYHDVGKMTTPLYFTENQQGGFNIHQLLTPKESAQVIIAHVSEGVAMARKAGLPEPFIDIIKEHHGTQLVYYFYTKELERCGGDTSQVNENEFRYAGPKPKSKESAIIMLADSLEAASRSLDIVNHETLTALANRLIKEKADDEQLDGCLLTFEELTIVKQILVKNLLASSHTRIKYPTRFVKGAEDA